MPGVPGDVSLVSPGVAVECTHVGLASTPPRASWERCDAMKAHTPLLCLLEVAPSPGNGRAFVLCKSQLPVAKVSGKTVLRFPSRPIFQVGWVRMRTLCIASAPGLLFLKSAPHAEHQ